MIEPIEPDDVRNLCERAMAAGQDAPAAVLAALYAAMVGPDPRALNRLAAVVGSHSKAEIALLRANDPWRN